MAALADVLTACPSTPPPAAGTSLRQFAHVSRQFLQPVRIQSSRLPRWAWTKQLLTFAHSPPLFARSPTATMPLPEIVRCPSRAPRPSIRSDPAVLDPTLFQVADCRARRRNAPRTSRTFLQYQLRQHAAANSDKGSILNSPGDHPGLKAASPAYALTGVGATSCAQAGRARCPASGQ